MTWQIPDHPEDATIGLSVDEPDASPDGKGRALGSNRRAQVHAVVAKDGALPTWSGDRRSASGELGGDHPVEREGLTCVHPDLLSAGVRVDVRPR